MKIADITVHQMATPAAGEGTNWTFVKVTTDTGIAGWGEGSLQYKDAALAAEISDFSRYLVGQDPFALEHIWTSLYRRVTWAGGPVSMSAISAIDLALWDIKGKALGLPVYALAGGPTRRHIRVYANGWTGKLGDPFAADPAAASASRDAHGKAARALADAGWQALKFYPLKGPQVVTPARMEAGVELVRSVRGAAGPGMEIAVDIRAQLDPWSARRVAERLQPLNVAWIEEPILYDNAAAMGAFARSIPIPVATGEQLYNRWQFEPLLEENAIAILQPDICHAGGFSELRKIASAAETHFIPIAPHNSNGPISTLASLHLGMSVPNFFMQEIFVSYLDRYNEVLTRPIVISQGHTELSGAPGWGADLVEEVIRSYPPQPFTQVASEPYLQF